MWQLDPPGASFVALHRPDCWAHDICTAHLYSHLPYGSAHSSAAQRGLPLRCQLFSSHCWNHPQKAFATIRESAERESIGHPSRSATPKASGTAFPSANALPSPFPSGASATHPVGLHTAAFHLQCFPTTPHDPPVNRAHFFTSHILTSIPTPHPSPTAQCKSQSHTSNPICQPQPQTQRQPQPHSPHPNANPGPTPLILYPTS